ncbi:MULTISPECIES: NUDIX hydrolase [unclassified Pseudomonas]|uniref:NUDIX hydrolase n=1 Tax=unclassified Pseudomonas TaxID=196821 RepID=UPI000EED8A6E|nr:MULTISPECIES: NUDIX domain-containing protein [Pseudomonas]MBH3338538.1 NUDIX domain-containing protein [Pseudomonas mendocina]HBZ93110.1 NUDIX hydrolase [Pseudomonas sp.]
MGKANKVRATVICRRGDKFLLVRKAEAKWNLPGGRIEANESADAAALRELDEETGLSFASLNYLASHEFGAGIHHVFHQSVTDTQTPRPQNEIADCGWFALEELGEMPVKRPSKKLLRRYCQAG